MKTLFTRLRLRSLAGALAMLLVLLKPTPAQAWFGWLDEWSGPGPWLGQLYEVRVACFGPKIDGLATMDQAGAEVREALKRIEVGLNRQRNAQTATMAPEEVIATLKQARSKWLVLIAELEQSESQVTCGIRR